MNSSSLFTVLLVLLKRELLLAARKPQALLNPLLFFMISVSLFPLAVSPDLMVLQGLAPGIIWVSALFACLLSLDKLFATDAQEGVLEQLLLTPHPLSLLVLIKITAHWLTTGLPLVFMGGLLSLFLNLPVTALPYLIASLALGTPLLSLIGAIGAALTVKLRQNGILLVLLVLPLYVPVLIFGTSAVAAASGGNIPNGELAWLGALLCMGIGLAPMAIGAALRIG